LRTLDEVAAPDDSDDEPPHAVKAPPTRPAIKTTRKVSRAARNIPQFYVGSRARPRSSQLCDQVAVAVNKKAASAGVDVPTVLLMTTSADADPSAGATTESTPATGENAVLANGETTIAGNDDHVPAGNRSK
jgi:hypothetical protein